MESESDENNEQAGADSNRPLNSERRVTTEENRAESERKKKKHHLKLLQAQIQQIIEMKELTVYTTAEYFCASFIAKWYRQRK